MIALDSPLWAELKHAYGSASDIPALLRQLERDPKPSTNYQREPWYSLWSALCHQGDAYNASYAAIPHIVRIALSSEGPIDFGFFQLPTGVEIARARNRGPIVPNSLAAAYRSAILNLHACANRHWAGDWDSATTLCALAALAVAKGQVEIAEAIYNLDDSLVARINAFDL